MLNIVIDFCQIFIFLLILRFLSNVFETTLLTNFKNIIVNTFSFETRKFAITMYVFVSFFVSILNSILNEFVTNIFDERCLINFMIVLSTFILTILFFILFEIYVSILFNKRIENLNKMNDAICVFAMIVKNEW